MTPPSISAEDVQAFLIARLAAMLEVPQAEVAAAREIDRLGVDSITIARMTEELREAFGLALPPELFYEMRNLDALAAHIAAAASQLSAQKLSKIMVAASFTAEPIEEPLGYLLHQAGVSAGLVFAPYNQVLQQLLDPEADFGRGPAVARVILLRVEDWFHYARHDLTAARAEKLIRHFGGALAAARKRLDGPLLVALCPHDKNACDSLAQCDHLVMAELASIGGVDLVDLRKIDTLHPHAALHDPARNRLGHIPYSEEGFAALAMQLGRRLHGVLRPSAKIIVADCDETLWQGVVGEDGPAGLSFGAGHLALQEFLLQRKRAGQLLALLSKNTEADVFAVFGTRPEMRLGMGDIVAHRIDWRPKPDNLRAIAGDLGLGLDSVVFVDDSPAECATMRAALPDVTVVELPRDAADYGRFLGAHWAFDTGAATPEDRRRTEMYQAARDRELLRREVQSPAAFLAELGVETTVRPLAPADLPRAAQLSHRTNQFNTTTIRRSETDFARLIETAPPRVLAIHVRDRFGDYGLVGLAVLEWSQAMCTIESFLLSCRVLGRRVEHGLIRHVADAALDRGIPHLRIRFTPSARNQPAQRFLAMLGDLSNGGIILAAGDIGAALARSEAALPASHAAEGPQTPSLPAGDCHAAHSIGLGVIAHIADPAALVAALAARTRCRPELDRPYLAPRTSIQAEIARIWCQILRLDRVGIDDDFFALGGDSLTGAHMAARLQDLGLPEQIGLGIMEQPTVAGLARAIEDVRNGHAPRLATSPASLEEQAMLSEDCRRDLASVGRTYLPAPVRTIFLTGATGYVGAHLIAELLTQPDLRIVCHVRAPDAQNGWRRLWGNLERYALSRQDFASRLSVVPGALEEPRMGLAEDLYERLAREVDAIIHNGARVNFIMPYGRLRGANVAGTLAALRFAAHARVKPLHFVSTLGVLMSGTRRDRVIEEAAELERSEDLPNGYEQTKWVADKIVWHAIQAGYPAAIYRLGMLSGLSRSGVYHKLDEFLPSFLKGCIQLGSFPCLESRIEMVPIDVATRAFAQIFARPQAIGRVFHMNHPAAITDQEFVAWIRTYGYPLRHLPWDIWKKELFGTGDRLRNNSLYPFLDFIRGLQAHQTRIPDMDMRNYFDLAADEVATCPSQTILLQRYFDHFVEVGFLHSPQPDLTCVAA
jgi:thioester reductase-like protein/FkbH-like protein